MSETLTIRNARVWTANPDQPWLSSVLVRDGSIFALDENQVRHQVKTVINANGQFVTPGLIDTHVHLLMGGESLSQIDLSEVCSREEFEQKLHLALTVTDGWLLANGWSQERWGGHMPDKSWLRAAGDRPVVAYRMDSHACLVNDAVLRLIDTGRDPEGGRIVRDSSGQPTGLLVEAAAWKLVNPVIPPSPLATKREALLLAQSHAHALGITCVGSMEYASQIQDVFLPQRAQLTLRVRFTLLDRELPLDFSFADSFPDDDRLAVIGFKTFLDGTLGSRSARMLADYTDEPGNSGLWVELAASEELQQWFDAVTKRGWQPAMHAIGDAAARLALDVISNGSYSGTTRDDVRPRIEHAQTIHPADLPRFSGIIASMQPLHRADDATYAEARLSRERLDRFFPFRSLNGAGAILAFGSDWPIVSIDPMLGIRAAVTGLADKDGVHHPEQCLTLEEALRAYTMQAAYALRCEDILGTIEIGKRGDMVIWDRNPFEIDWREELPQVVMTIVDGDVVHADSAARF